MANLTMDKIVSLCKRRGFIFQSSEIYGGQGGAWDYGPLGVELKNNIKRAWWRANVLERPDMVGLDAAILMNPRVWEASGHVGHFADPMVDCRQCKRRFRADDLELPPAPVVDVQNAHAWNIREGSRRIFALDGVQIDAPGTGTRLALVRFNSSNVLPTKEQFASLPLEGLNQLIRDETLLPGSRRYRIVFELPVDVIGSAAILTLVFSQGGTILQAVDLTISLLRGLVALRSAMRICPDCGGELTEPRMFNLMFKTFVGPVEEEAATTYLRPETAQGIFVNFANVLTAMRRKLPFGIAQIGKAFRNEITPGNFTFRSREFEQMEIEFFVKPGDDEEWHHRWIQERLGWYTGLGMDAARLRLRVHGPEELSHYSKGTTDIDYLFPMGWSELEGIANRTDFDLKQHTQFSGEPLTYFDEDAKEHIVPYVIEPSAGADRAALAFLLDAYREEEAPTGTGGTETRTVLRLHKDLAPVKVAVLPLSRNEKLLPTGQEVYALLRKGLSPTASLVQYDDAQSIGRRYRRQDETGTPFCVTVDFDTLEDRAVTIRERDSMAQERVPIAELVAALRERLG